EADPHGPAALVVPGLDLAGVEVDPPDLVAEPHVDVVVATEGLRAAGHQVADVVDQPADQVGDAAGRVARPAPPLEHDDLAVGLPAAHLHGGAHAGGVAADDQEASGHDRRLGRDGPRGPDRSAAALAPAPGEVDV